MKVYFQLLWINIASRYSILGLIVVFLFFKNPFEFITVVEASGSFAVRGLAHYHNMYMSAIWLGGISFFVFATTFFGRHSYVLYQKIVYYDQNFWQTPNRKEIISKLERSLWPCQRAAASLAKRKLKLRND